MQYLGLHLAGLRFEQDSQRRQSRPHSRTLELG